MNEVKFTCPSCGQHIRCEPSHGGENVPCPGCATLIRVPQPAADFLEVPKDSEDAPNEILLSSGPEKVSYAPAQSDAQEKELGTTAATPDLPQNSEPASSGAVTNQEMSSPIAAAHDVDVHCTCPNCRTPLQISIRAESVSDPTPAPTSNSQPEPLSLADRERKIEAARKAHPASSSFYPPIKPRLDKILDGSR